MKQTNLRSLIADSFNISELRSLCFDLGINFENLPGETLEDKSRELITYCKRQGRLEDLISRCRELRPQKNWPSFRNSDSEPDTEPDIELSNAPWFQENLDVSVDKVKKFGWGSILLTILVIIVGWFLVLRPFMSRNTLKYGNPIKLADNSYVIKLAGNEIIEMFDGKLEISFVEKPDGTVVVTRGSLFPDIGRLDVRSLGYPRQTFYLSLNETAFYESNGKFSILVTDIYFPDSDWGKSDAYIEFVLTNFIINGDPNGNHQLQTVVSHTPTPSAQSVCGNALDLEFLQNDDQIETNNGRWRLVLAEGNSTCWYKVTHAGISSGEEADTTIGAGPFRMGIEPHADFPCSDVAFDVWANVDGWEPSDWIMIGGPFLLSPSFCE